MKYIFTILFFLFFTEEIFAQRIKIDTLENGYEIEIRISELTFKKTSEQDSIPILDNSEYIFEKNAPELLKVSRLFYAFAEENFKIEILIDSTEIIKASIAPSLGFLYQEEEIPTRKKGNSYSKNQLFPKEIIKSFPIVKQRNNYLQNFWIHFIQYNPAKKELILHKHLKIRFTQTNFSAKALKNSKAENTQEKLLILTPDSMKQTLFAFIRWKKQLGIEVFTETFQSKPTIQQVQTVITEYYQAQNINYVLLVGDSEQIPTNSSNYGPVDYVYSLISGNDVYCDLSIGRFPADNNSELLSMISKTINYEQALYLNDKNISAGGIASAEGTVNSGDNGETDLQHISNINKLFSRNNFDTLLIAENIPTENSVSELFNKSNYLFYAGHGSETQISSVEFTNDSVLNLKNSKNHPIFIDAACLNGRFTYNDCFAENLMKANSKDSAFGTTAMLASTISQLWAPPMLGQDVFAEELFSAQSQVKILGNITQTMFSELISKYDAGGIETVYTWALFGDPSLKLWKTNLPELTVSAPDKIDISSDFLTVEADENSLVTLVKDTTISAKAIAENGSATLTYGAMPQIDSVLLTVSKPQHKPFVRILKPYTEAGSYYSISALSTQDENNQIPENNEWITVRPKLVNYGKQTGQNILITVSEENNLVEFDRNEIIIESLAGNSTEKEFNFKIRTTGFIPDNEKIKLNFKIEDESGQINQKKIDFSFYAPIAVFEKLAVNENWTAAQTVTKNDTVIISAVISNTGHAPLYNAKLRLNVNDVFVNSLESELIIDELAPLSKDTFHVKLIVNSGCYFGHKFTGTLNLEEKYCLPFSFFYKENPNIELGNKEFWAEEFPFYNYYKANKSQMLYTSEMLNNKAVKIDSIGFWFSQITTGDVYRKFSNFQIKFRETEIADLAYNFEDMENSVVALAEEEFLLPDTTGLFFIDIEDFSYSGTENLLMEILWGMNTAYASYNNSFEVLASETDYTSTVFGYSDNNFPPEYRKNANYLPDIVLSTHSTELFNVNFLLQENETINPEDTFLLKVGGNSQKITLGKDLFFRLPEGSFPYTLLSANELKILYTDTLILSQNNQTEVINYKKATSVTNSVLNEIKAYFFHENLYIKQKVNRYSKYEIFDTNGKLIKTGKLNKPATTISLKLKQGIYFIRLRGKKEIKIFKLFKHQARF